MRIADNSHPRSGEMTLGGACFIQGGIARLASVVVLLAFTANSVAAERWRDSLPQGKIYYSLGFFSSFHVQSELKFTIDQKRIHNQAMKLKSTRVREAVAQFEEEGVGLGGEDSKRRYVLFMRMESEAANSVFDALDEQQQERAVELSLQRAGEFAFREKRLASELALSDEQRDTVEAIFDEYSAKMDASANEFRDDRERKSADYRRLSKERRKSVVAVLTEDQLAKYKSLQGELSTAIGSDD